LKPLHTLEFVVAYNVALNIACPKQEQMKGVATENNLPLISKFC
jgi:hypothetical protein